MSYLYEEMSRQMERRGGGAMELKGRGHKTPSFFLISLFLCKSSANSPCHSPRIAMSNSQSSVKAPWLGKPTLWTAGALMVLKHLTCTVFEVHLPCSLLRLVSRELVINLFPTLNRQRIDSNGKYLVILPEERDFFYPLSRGEL